MSIMQCFLPVIKKGLSSLSSGLPTVFLLFLSFLPPLLSQTKVLVTAIPGENAPIVSRHIYGHFAEHLGQCIYGGFYVGDGSSILKRLPKSG